MLRSPQSVLSFWFGDAFTVGVTKTSLQSCFTNWFFSPSSEFVEMQVASRRLVEEVASGAAEDPSWADESQQVVLAKIILFDQFPRTIWKGEGEAFKFDTLAAELALKAFKENDWCVGTAGPEAHKYNHIERLTVGLCFQHSEDINMQNLGIELAETAFQDCEDEELKAKFDMMKSYFYDHQRVVAKFNRFPHRNILLGRESTPEEIEWLASDDVPAWAKIAPKK